MFLESSVNVNKTLYTMRHIKLIVIGLFLSNFIFGQTIKIQTGTTLSKLDWKIGNMNWPAKVGNIGGTIDDKTMTINVTIGYKL